MAKLAPKVKKVRDIKIDFQLEFEDGERQTIHQDIGDADSIAYDDRRFKGGVRVLTFSLVQRGVNQLEEIDCLLPEYEEGK